MAETRGDVTILRSQNGATPDRILIVVGAEGRRRVMAELTLEQFALAVTGLACHEAKVTLYAAPTSDSARSSTPKER